MKKKSIFCTLGVFAIGATIAYIATAQYFRKTFAFSEGLGVELDEAFASLEGKNFFNR